MRHGEPGDPPRYPRLQGECPDCGQRPCRCEDEALEQDDEVENGGEA